MLTVTCILITLLLLSIWTLTFAKILSTLWREPDNNTSNNKTNNNNNNGNKNNNKNNNINKDQLLINNNNNRKNRSLTVESQESLRSALLLSPNPSHRLSLPRRYSDNNSSNSSLGEDITYTEQERLKKKSTMKRRNGLALRKVSAMTSPEAIRGAEMKLLRVFACMLVCSSWWVMYLYSSTWWSGWSILEVFRRTRTSCSISCIRWEAQLSRWRLC